MTQNFNQKQQQQQFYAANNQQQPNQVFDNGHYANGGNQQYQNYSDNGQSMQNPTDTMQSPFPHLDQLQQKQQKGHLQHLQRRVYPGMGDESFDSTMQSSQDKYLMNNSMMGQSTQSQQQQQMQNTGRPGGAGVGYQNAQPGYSNNLFQETQSTPSQQSIDQRQMSGQSNLNPVDSTNQKIQGDQMPRPIKLLNSYNYRAGIPDRYQTKSLDVPPSAAIPFLQIDEGQVGPKYMRGTTIQVPQDGAFITQSCLPFGFIVQPLAEQTNAEYNNEWPDIPIVDYQDEGPFRCYRCKAYVNPNMTFQDSGAKAQCNLCLFINDVPVNYQSQLNEFGQRRDRQQRPELLYGAYEFRAPAAYLTRPPLNPVFVFVIDVSQFSHPLGFFHQIVQSIKMTLDYMQNPENTQICIITYDINIHFYNLPQDPNGEPNVLQLGEIIDPFIPYPKEKLMLKLVDDRERIDIFLDKLLNLHNAETKKQHPPHICTGAAISAAKQLIADEGGRILVFSSHANTAGFGQITARDDPKLYNTDKEKVLLSPINDFYIKLAQECVTQRICVDLIYALKTQQSIDVTTVAPLAAQTGGDILYINNYDINKHSEKLHYEIFRILTRPQGSEVAIKARTSTGLTVTEYFGGFGVKESADFELSAIDSDKSIGFSIRMDDKLKDDQLSYVQFAMMYSNQFGERRIRVFNYCLTVAKSLNAYYKAADQETLSQFFVKKEIARIMQRGAKQTREAIINNLVTLLFVYRQKCAAQTSPQQLVLPENLKLLPLYTLSALKSNALKMLPGCKLDEKIVSIYKLLKMPLSQMPYFFYPRVYKITDIGTPDSTFGSYVEGSQLMQKPMLTHAQLEKLGHADAYIIDNSEYIYFYIGNKVDDSFIQNVFGYSNFSDLKFNGVTTFAPYEGNDLSQTLWNFIEQLRYEKTGVAYAPLRLILGGEGHEKELIEQCLVENSIDINKEFPYNDFLCMLHKLIRNKNTQ